MRFIKSKVTALLYQRSSGIAIEAIPGAHLMEEGKTVFPNGAHVNGAEGEAALGS